MGGGNVTITKEGNLASFYTVNKVPIKHLKVYFSPKQAGEGTPSPSNVREISGWNVVQSYKTKKNMVQVTGYGVKGTFTGELSNGVGTTINNANYNLPDMPLIVAQSQTPNTNTKQAFQNGFITIFVNNLIFNQYYDISFRITDIKSNPLNTEFRDLALLLNGNAWHYCSQVINDTIIFKNIRWKRYSDDPSNSNYNNSYFEIRICGMSFTLSEFMVTPANTNNGIFEPYSGSASIIDWTDEVGTVYGGYVDLVTGELVQTHAIKRIVGNEDWYMASGISGACAYRPTLLNITFASDDYIAPICDKLSGVAKWGTTINECTINNYGHFYFGAPDELSTSEAVNNWIQSIGGFEFTYPISPITHQLAPTQLQTLIGRNNIWSNADHVEVEYDLAESNDELYRRRNILLRSAPHIEMAVSDDFSLVNTSGTISRGINHAQASFTTDVSGNLKNTRIYFYPRQPGEYDPSPDNVRPIYGHTGLKIWNNTPLPAEYQQVEYIRGSRSRAVIDTGVTSADDSLEFDFCFEKSDHANFDAVFGNTIGENSNSYRFIMPANSTSKAYYWCANTKTGESRPVVFSTLINDSTEALNTKIHAYLNYNIGIMEINGKSQITKFSAFPRADENNTNTILLNSNGASRTPGTTELSAKTTFYYFKIWKAGKLIRHLVPCYRKVDHEVGMYDVVEGKFYERFGKSTYGTPFVAGPDVNTNGYVTEVDWSDSIGEVYGGYIDLEKSILVKTHDKVIINGSLVNDVTSVSENQDAGRVTAWCLARDISGYNNSLNTYLINGAILKSNILKNIGDENGLFKPYTINTFFSYSDYNISICFTLPSGENGIQTADVAGVRAYLSQHPFELVGRKVTPITYQLNPMQLRSLRGVNNIWSNANGPVEVSYWTH